MGPQSTCQIRRATQPRRRHHQPASVCCLINAHMVTASTRRTKGQTPSSLHLTLSAYTTTLFSNTLCLVPVNRASTERFDIYTRDKSGDNPEDNSNQHQKARRSNPFRQSNPSRSSRHTWIHKRTSLRIKSVDFPPTIKNPYYNDFGQYGLGFRLRFAEALPERHWGGSPAPK